MGRENSYDNFQVSSNEYISKILNSKKIRYEKLNELFQFTIPYDKRLVGKQVNIFIDLAAVIKQLYNPDLLDHFKFLKEKDRIIISSEVLNMVGHYRRYFASRRQMYTRFFFYFSYAKSKYHTEIYDDYKKDYYEKRNNLNNITFGVLSRILQYNMKLIKTILNYIPNAYFIDTGIIEPSIIPHYIISEMSEEDDFNLIISNDDLYYQDLFIKDRTYILELRGNDKTELIYHENLMDVLLRDTKKVSSDFPNVFPKDILIIDPMIVHKDYNIASVGRRGYSTSMGAINKLKNRDFLGDNSYDIDSLENLAEDLFPNNDRNQYQYKENISLVNHELYMNLNYDLIKNKVENQIIDLSNDKELVKLNEAVYNRYPLNLDFILQSEVDDREVLSDII